MDEPDAADSGRAQAASFPGLSDVTPLGVGGMGTVFKAWQDDLQRPVAVKTLRADLAATEELREQFAREAHILGRLDHPGIVPVHYAGETASGPYYVMRLVEGLSVERYLAGASAVEVASVFRGIAEALAAAHREGVLHRDIKPANVLVEPSGRAILVDFGLATRATPGDAGSAGEGLVGTPDYLAPELLEGAGYSPASDVYALGATLYLVLTGRVPFPAEDLDEKLRAIREEDPPPPRALLPDVPKPLQAICLAAMERAPGDRYASAEELQRDLERFLAGDPVHALPERSRSLLRRKIERHLADHGEWEDQGLLDERQRVALQFAYEHLDEEQRGLLRGALGSLPNLLLLAGLLLSVFGPVLLQIIAWDGLAPAGRLTLPGAPLVLLAAVGLARWHARDRRRGVACLIGAALLAIPTAFALVDLVPALRTVVDDGGGPHAVLPGRMSFPADDAPAWVLAGARLLEWKVLAAATLVLALVLALYRYTRSAFFLWLLGAAVTAAVLSGALLAGWRDLPLAARWALAVTGSLAVIAAGVPLDRRWERDRALPFYGLGFAFLCATVLTYASEGMPVTLLVTPPEGFDSAGCAFLLHGLGIVAGALVAHHRGTALQHQVADAPFLAGFLMAFVGLSGLSMHGGWAWETLEVVTCVGFLLLGLGLHRNSLVLPASILLPFAVGSVSQRHLDTLWAWSITIVLVGVALVLLAFRLSGRGARDPGAAGGRLRGSPGSRRRGRRSGWSCWRGS